MPRIFEITRVSISLLKSTPPVIFVYAEGRTNTSSWKNIRLQPIAGNDNSDGVLELEMLGEAPTGISMPVLTNVSDTYDTQDGADKIVSVIVHGRSNSVTAHLNPGVSGPDTVLQRRDPWDNSDVFAQRAGLQATSNFGPSFGPTPWPVPPTRWPFPWPFPFPPVPDPIDPRAAAFNVRPTQFTGEDVTTRAVGEEGSNWQQWGETPPLSWDVEKMAAMAAEKMAWPISEKIPSMGEKNANGEHAEGVGLNNGSTNPAADTAGMAQMFSSPFGKR